jgi:hypothetical protein
MVTFFLAAEAASLAFVKDKPILRNVQRSIWQGIITPENFPMSPYGHSGFHNDRFTDCLAISINLGNENLSLLYRLAATPYVLTPREGEPQSPCGMLVKDVLAKDMHPEIPYYRYWHGHQIYLRPLLSSMPLDRIHVINALLLIIAFTFMTKQLGPLFGKATALLILIPMATNTHILTAPTSTVHALSWITAFGSIGAMAYWMQRHHLASITTILLCFALGCVGAFFDLLFSPPFTPTFVAFLAVVIGLQRGPTRDALFDAGQLAFAWFAGFSLAWISKWGFALTVFTMPEVIANLTDAISRRSFADDTIDVSRSLFTATGEAMNALRPGVIYAALALCVSLAIWAALRRRFAQQQVRHVILMLLPLLLPILWVEVLRDHTIVHPGFAARSFILFAVLPLLAAMHVGWALSVARPAADVRPAVN